MKEFWKKSAALLMAISLLMGNNYAIHASGEEGEQPPETQETTPEGDNIQGDDKAPEESSGDLVVTDDSDNTGDPEQPGRK